MRKGVLVFAVIAFALTGGTIYFVNSWMKQERSRIAERAKKSDKNDGVFVLVAAKDLPAGHLIAVSDLRWQSWPDRSVPSQYIVRRGGSANIPSNYVGTAVRRGVVASGPITSENLIKLGDRGFLTAVLKPGTRAISIRVDEATVVAGLVHPGDRVDLILTHEVPVKTREGDRDVERKHRVGETILSNVRVIAIDQSLDDLKSAKADAKTRTPKTATVEVTPRQAEIVAVAAKMGTITLTLQSLACAGGETQAASAGDGPNCTEPLSALPEEPERGKTFTSDSDVSRMRRSADNESGDAQVTVLRGTEKGKQADREISVRLVPEPAAPKN